MTFVPPDHFASAAASASSRAGVGALIVDPGHPGLADLVRAARTGKQSVAPDVDPHRPPVALVTGASSGVGRSLVLRLVAEGWRVGALARSATALADLAAGQPEGRVLPLVADVTDVVAMAEASAALTALWRIPDLVVANAGVYRAVGNTWEVDTASWWSDLEVNLLGVINTLHVTVPGMISRKSGRFIAMSSGMGRVATPWSSAYGASKAAVNHLIASLGAELAGTGVAAFAISPGMVRTEMTRWPQQLLVHRADLADLPDSAFWDLGLVGDLVTDLASGRFDAMSGRFIHVADDREELLAQGCAD